ncbi:MAG: hypothetical protein ACYC9Z_10825 [Casimicrobiaceae bacterium]
MIDWRRDAGAGDRDVNGYLQRFGRANAVLIAPEITKAAATRQVAPAGGVGPAGCGG